MLYKVLFSDSIQILEYIKVFLYLPYIHIILTEVSDTTRGKTFCKILFPYMVKWL